MSERDAFVKVLTENEDDDVTRLVFADWLDEHDEPEEADRMRRWRASKEWMLDWVRSVNYGKWEYDDDRDYKRDEKGERIRATKDNLGDPHTLKHAIEAGHYARQGKIYCWGSDDGADFFRENRGSGTREWFYHWSTLTGLDVPNLDDIVESPPFRCGC